MFGENIINGLQHKKHSNCSVKGYDVLQVTCEWGWRRTYGDNLLFLFLLIVGERFKRLTVFWAICQLSVMDYNKFKEFFR